ncbi:hypothetical protein C3L33_14424, partial [Rhododendron williamsianum]
MTTETVFVELCKGINGLDKVVLREVRGSSAEVYLYGGQVTSWKNDHGEELLFVSSKAPFKPPKAIRGGIPICFPQFGSHGLLEQHGFARNRFWSIDPDPPPFPTTSSNKAFVDLVLKHSEEDTRIWPHRYEFRLRVTLGPGGDLMLTSRIRNTNTDGKAFTFTFAYHNYFSVSDISEVRIEGLETIDFLDNLQDRQRFTEQGDAITFESEVSILLESKVGLYFLFDLTFVLRKDGLPDAGETLIMLLHQALAFTIFSIYVEKTLVEFRVDVESDTDILCLVTSVLLSAVVWNPWDKKAKAIPDLGDDEYKHMLCVEAAAVEKPITLKPGEEWKGRQEISAVPSSYFSGQLDPKKVLQSSS